MDIFNRVELLLGEEAMERIAAARVIIFGVGGVGSWTAEALVRSGVRHLTIVDADVVAETNVNRQLMATTVNIGKSKVEELRRRLLEINPEATVEARHEMYDAERAEQFDLNGYDYVVDAIDSLSSKAALINQATRAKTRLVSSMGAALKLDPARIQTAEFWKVTGCPLAAALRRRFKKSGVIPRRKFQCVFSPELLANKGKASEGDSAMSYTKVATNGALCHVTAIFGMTLAGLIIKELATKN